jgi:hypothetical protein
MKNLLFMTVTGLTALLSAQAHGLIVSWSTPIDADSQLMHVAVAVKNPDYVYTVEHDAINVYTSNRDSLISAIALEAGAIDDFRGVSCNIRLETDEWFPCFLYPIPESAQPEWSQATIRKMFDEDGLYWLLVVTIPIRMKSLCARTPTPTLDLPKAQEIVVEEREQEKRELLDRAYQEQLALDTQLREACLYDCP